MLNIGISEFLIIGLVALILLGPEQLPSTFKTLARVIRDLRSASSKLREQIDPEITSAAQELQRAIHEPEPKKTWRPQLVTTDTNDETIKETSENFAKPFQPKATPETITQEGESPKTEVKTIASDTSNANGA